MVVLHRFYCAVVIWLHYSGVVYHVGLLYTVVWTIACIYIIFLMENLIPNFNRTECGVDCHDNIYKTQINHPQHLEKTIH